MKKIIHYIDALRDNGAETIVREYASLIDNQLFETVIVVNILMPFTVNSRLIEEQGIRIIPIYNKFGVLQRIWNKVLGSWYIPKKLKSIIVDEAPDVLHVHMALLKHVRKIKKNLKQIKLFYTCHSLPERYFDGKNKSEYRAAKDLMINNGLKLLALQENMKTELDTLFGIDNTNVIHNGIDFERYRFDENDKMETRRQIGLPQNAFVIGHVGRFFYGKNHVFLLDIFKEILEINKDAYLLLVGDGELKREIEEKINKDCIESHVKILSHRDDIPQLLNAMDRFIFPSLFEGLGIAVIEAQIAGLKCVISDRIPKEALISKSVIVLSLNDKPAEWAQQAVFGKFENTIIYNIEDYNMRREILKLQELYLEE